MTSTIKGGMTARRITQMVALRDRLDAAIYQFLAARDRPHHWEGRAVGLRNRINRRLDAAWGAA